MNPWVGKIPWRMKWKPTPVFLPGKSHGQRSLADYIVYGVTESDVTERLSMRACGDWIRATVDEPVVQQETQFVVARTGRAEVGMGRNDLRRYVRLSQQDWKVSCGALV